MPVLTRFGEKKINVAVFGGSFDPPHNGHVELAEYVLEHSPVELLIVVPVFEPPHKSRRELSPYAQRLEMTRLAFAPLVAKEKVAISDIESHLPMPSYTWRTLRHFQDENRQWNVRLVIGQDMYDSFESWMNYRQILEEFSLVVLTRFDAAEEGHKAQSDGKHVFLDNPLWHVSSTEIREMVSRWHATGDESLLARLQKLVPGETLQYIIKNDLYR